MATRSQFTASIFQPPASEAGIFASDKLSVQKLIKAYLTAKRAGYETPSWVHPGMSLWDIGATYQRLGSRPMFVTAAERDLHLSAAVASHVNQISATNAAAIAGAPAAGTREFIEGRAKFLAARNRTRSAEYLSSLHSMASYYDPEMGGFIQAMSVGAEPQTSKHLFAARPWNTISPVLSTAEGGRSYLQIIEEASGEAGKSRRKELLSGVPSYLTSDKDIWNALSIEQQFAIKTEALDILDKPHLYKSDYAYWLQEGEEELLRLNKAMAGHRLGDNIDSPFYRELTKHPGVFLPGESTLGEVIAMRQYARRRGMAFQDMSLKTFSPEYLQSLGIAIEEKTGDALAVQYKEPMRSTGTGRKSAKTGKVLGSGKHRLLMSGGSVSGWLIERASPEEISAGYTEVGKISRDALGRRMALEERRSLAILGKTENITYSRGPMPKDAQFLAFTSENYFTKAYRTPSQALAHFQEMTGQSKGLLSAGGSFIPLGSGKIIGVQGALERDILFGAIDTRRKLMSLASEESDLRFINRLRAIAERHQRRVDRMGWESNPLELHWRATSQKLFGIGGDINERIPSIREISTAKLLRSRTQRGLDKISREELLNVVGPLKRNIRSLLYKSENLLEPFVPVAGLDVGDIRSQVDFIQGLEAGAKVNVEMRGGKQQILTVADLPSSEVGTVVTAQGKSVLARKLTKDAHERLAVEYGKLFPQVKTAADLDKVLASSLDIPVFLRRDLMTTESGVIGKTSVLTAAGDVLGDISDEAEKVLRGPQIVQEGLYDRTFVAQVVRGEYVAGKRGYDLGLNVIPMSDYMNTKRSKYSQRLSENAAIVRNISADAQSKIIDAIEASEQFTGRREQFAALGKRHAALSKKYETVYGGTTQHHINNLISKNKKLEEMLNKQASQASAQNSWVDRAARFYQEKPGLAWGITAAVATAGFLMMYGALKQRKPLDMGENDQPYPSGADGTESPVYSPRQRISATAAYGRSTRIDMDSEAAGDMRGYQDGARDMANYARAQLAASRVGVDFNVQDHSRSNDNYMMRIRAQDMLRR